MPSKVLLIEDDEASQLIFSTVLRHHGYEVLQAWRASDALRMAGQVRPDLVILDIGLPGIDGFEVARRLKGDPATREIPILVVTVHVFERDQREALEAGCDYFFAKPMEPRLLVSEVRRILDRVGTASAAERD